MKLRALCFALAALVVSPAFAQEKKDVKPILRLEAGGPTSNVTALAFSPDGKTLYAAGFDKVVRGYAWNAATKSFELKDTLAFRIPIGPGIDGAINSIALSDDGQWLAIASFGVIAEGMKFNESGRVIPTKGGATPSTRADRGQITVFNTRDRSARTLRGHTGPVLSMAFERPPANQDNTPLRLISAAEGWDTQTASVAGEVIVWNVPVGDLAAAPAIIAGTLAMPALTFSRRPGVALVGSRAYLAWGDGQTVEWDIKGNSTKFKSPANNSTVDHSGANRVLTAGNVGYSAVLQQFEGVPIGGAERAKEFKFQRPAAADEFDLPIVARYLGNAHAVVFLRHMKDFAKKSNAPVHDTLAIVELDPRGGFGKQVATHRLGDANRIFPAFAISKDHIAIGGFPDHRILIFDAAQAVAGGGQPQILKSTGTTMRWAQFVKKEGDRGIAVSTSPDAAKADAILDLTRGKLTDDVAGWASDAAAPGDYRIAIAGSEVQLLKGNQAVSTSTIKEGSVTAVAVLPPIGDQGPLLAVASYIPLKGTTILEIIDGATSAKLRLFAGHTAAIQSLSFRADGKLLVSAADDQTTIVWSLTDLGDVVGKHGSLGQLAVELKGKDLTIIDIDGEKQFAVGDIVRGIYDKTGKLQPLPNSGAFYEALWMNKPGKNAKFRVSKGGVENDVEATVRQGADVRKPLFTLFFPKDAAGKLGDWIGWNAIGPYDSSRRDAEKYLGWHFNTGKADQPTSFAFIDQYRKEYFRPGILKQMSELGDLPQPPKAPAPKPVLLVPGVAEDGVLLTRVGGEYLVRKKSIELHVTITGYDPLPGDQLTWQFGNGPAKAFEAADGNLWTAAVDLPAGGEPMRRVTVRLKRTPEGWPVQEQSADVALRMIAPPPKLTMNPPPAKDAKEAEAAELPVTVRIEPGDVGIGYSAVLVHESLGRVIASRDVKAAKASDLEAKFTLEPGLNVIRVRAVNDRAVGRPHENDEAAVAVVKIAYQPRKIVAPSLSFNRLVPAAGNPIPILGNEVRFRSAKTAAAIAYAIQSEDPLTTLEWDAGEGTKREKLDPANAKQMIQARFKPGRQTIRVFFKTDKSPEVSAHLAVEMRPPTLESLRIANLEDGFKVVGDGDKGETPLELQFTPLELEYKLPLTIDAVVFSKGNRVKEEAIVVDAAAGTAKFEKLPLVPGNNEIQVRLRHDFGDEEHDVVVHGSYVRPPKIASLVAAPVGKAPFADVTAQVLSAIEPAQEYITVTVNGRTVRPSAVDIKKGNGGRDWIVEAKQVPLAAAKGQNVKSDITMSLSTSDGTTQASLKEPIVFALPLPPTPEIVLLEPATRTAIVDEPLMNFRFKVTTQSPLTRVELVRGEKTLKRWDELPVSENGEYAFSLPNVPLDWSLNSLSIVAINEGGHQTSNINITVPPQPVQLRIEHAEVPAVGLKINPATGGVFAPLPTGQLVLHGTVRWNSNDDPNLQKAKQVRLFVNGFQQLPVEMKPVAGKARERKFQIPVVLNSKDNQIEIDLPELKQDASNRSKISLSCMEPVRGQHLHVLVIAPQEKDEARLVNSLIRSIKAKAKGPEEYKTDVFEQVRFYVLGKHVRLEHINSRLDRIAEELKKRALAGSPNDLVMIYFQGKETVEDRGPVLWTSEASPWLQLTLSDLSNGYLSRFSGGQVLILDTISKAGKVELDDARFALLRRGDPRPLADLTRTSLTAELEKGMQSPRVIYLDDLQRQVALLVATNFQSFTPEPMRGRIQLNPN